MRRETVLGLIIAAETIAVAIAQPNPAWLRQQQLYNTTHMQWLHHRDVCKGTAEAWPDELQLDCNSFLPNSEPRQPQDLTGSRR